MSDRSGTEGGRRGRRARVTRGGVLAVVGLALLGLVAVTATGLLLYRQAQDALTRVPVDELSGQEEGDQVTDAQTGPVEATVPQGRNYLVVGSDEREGDVPEDVPSGDFDGERADAILLVSLSDERETVSVVNLPRDLVVRHQGVRKKLGETFDGGPGALVTAVQDNFGVPVHHFAHMTFGGFIEAVRTLGGVEVCLEQELVDEKAGADLEAGCQQLDGADALAYVRSREGELADFDRIERQQRFLRATLDRLTEGRVLADVPRLFDLVEDLAGNVTTDADLSLSDLLGLADELRDAIDEDVPMASVPAHPITLGRQQAMQPYVPGARALFRAVVEGEPIPDRGSRAQREEVAVGVWIGATRQAIENLSSTLLFAGYEQRRSLGAVPDRLEPAPGVTTVYAPATGGTADAEMLANLLGAPLKVLPEGVDLPADLDVAVAVGEDAEDERVIDEDDDSTRAAPRTQPDR